MTQKRGGLHVANHGDLVETGCEMGLITEFRADLSRV